VAKQALAIAGQLGLSRAEQQRVNRAALLHDLGVVTIPLAVLEKQEPLTDAEREYVRLHSHYTERLLERVEPLRHLALEASADHEWVNGEGYHRRLVGDQIPLIGRILAVADTHLASVSTHLGAPESEYDLLRLQPLVGTQLDRTCYDALASALTGLPSERQHVARAAPDHLSEREVEVLQLLARGLSNPQIAHVLVISKKTVEHHLEHIYNKLGVSTRTSAVAYAVHQGLTQP
jgi:HD-GYP domain-containing protein (c-di-GMP phosphodiesterase class II)